VRGPSNQGIEADLWRSAGALPARRADAGGVRGSRWGQTPLIPKRSAADKKQRQSKAKGASHTCFTPSSCFLMHMICCVAYNNPLADSSIIQ